MDKVKLPLHKHLMMLECLPSNRNMNITLLDHIKAIRQISEREWKIVATDAGIARPTRLLPYFNLTEPGNVEHFH